MVKSAFVFVVLTAWLQFATSDLDSLSRLNFQIGISSVGVRLSNSTDTQCERDLKVFLNSIEENELWAAKLIDAFGATPHNFYWGNWFWFTPGELCEDLNTPIRVSLSDRYNHKNFFNTSSPYPVRLWMVYLNFTSPVRVDMHIEHEYLIHVGLCLPQSCSQSEVINFTQTYFSSKSFDLQHRFDIEMDVAEAKSPEFKWSFFLKGGMLISFAYMALIAILMIVADRIRKQKLPKTDQLSKMDQFFLCFHLKDNFNEAIGTGDSQGFFPTIAGIRSILCIWITVAHVVYFSSLAINNTFLIFSKLEYFLMQPFVTSAVYEDGFFVLSAFLLVYNFLANVEQMKAIKANSLKENFLLFLRQIFNRYMRLLPVVLATLIGVDLLYDYLEMSSSFYLGECNSFYCKKNWDYAILLLNNILDLKHMCAVWTWYLGCDMQLFIATMGLLIVFAKNNSLGKSLFKIILVVGVAISFFCQYYYKATFEVDVFFGSISQLFTKPWIRMNSYTGGALVAWVFHKRNGNPVRLNGLWKSVFWTGALLIFLITTFMSYWRVPPLWLMATIMSIGKLLFAFYIGALIVFCEWGNGGLLTKILTSRPLLIVNNLSYTIYMTTPIVITAIYAQQPVATNLNLISITLNAISIFVVSIIFSFLVVLWVEAPAEKIRSKYLNMKSRKAIPPSTSNKDQ